MVEFLTALGDGTMGENDDLHTVIMHLDHQLLFRCPSSGHDREDGRASGQI